MSGVAVGVRRCRPWPCPTPLPWAVGPACAREDTVRPYSLSRSPPRRAAGTRAEGDVTARCREVGRRGGRTFFCSWTACTTPCRLWCTALLAGACRGACADLSLHSSTSRGGCLSHFVLRASRAIADKEAEEARQIREALQAAFDVIDTDGRCADCCVHALFSPPRRRDARCC